MKTKKILNHVLSPRPKCAGCGCDSVTLYCDSCAPPPLGVRYDGVGLAAQQTGTRWNGIPVAPRGRTDTTDTALVDLRIQMSRVPSTARFS